jgi:hypothetical protein
MLITQAKVLEYVCYDSLGRLSSAEMHDAEIYANIALRAQNQSRKTLLALGELKNPRHAVFVKQQNNALNQQINNLAENSKKVANELLESKQNEQWMDGRTQATTIGINQAMEALEISRS